MIINATYKTLRKEFVGTWMSHAWLQWLSHVKASLFSKQKQNTEFGRPLYLFEVLQNTSRTGSSTLQIRTPYSCIIKLVIITFRQGLQTFLLVTHFIVADVFRTS
jgi:hypothetical protein